MSMSDYVSMCTTWIKKKKKEIRDFIVRMAVGFRLHFIPVSVLAQVMGVVATSDH